MHYGLIASSGVFDVMRLGLQETTEIYGGVFVMSVLLPSVDLAWLLALAVMLVRGQLVQAVMPCIYTTAAWPLTG